MEHYKFAVNAAIVDYQFGTEEGAIHLAAANIQPIRTAAVVPQQGCIPLQDLPPGRDVTTAEGCIMESTALKREDFRLVLQEVEYCSVLASERLQDAVRQYQR